MHVNWKTYKLGEIADIKGGKRLPKGDTLVLKKTTHPYIRVTDMGTRTIPIEKVQYVPNDVFPKISRYIVNTNDLILSIVGTVGSISIIDEKLDNASLTENCVKITNLKDVDNLFLYYYLMSDVGQFEISKGIVGSTQPKLPIYNINALEIVLPENLQEQQSIASILSAIDDKIENNLAINKTLEEIAMALYKHWLVDFGPFQEGEFFESELGMIPKGWEVIPFLDLFKLLSGGTPKTTVEDYWNGDIYWVSAKDIGSNSGGSYINDTEKKITQLGIDKSAAKILPEDTVIVVARGSVGKFGIIAKPMAINQSCYGIYSKSDYSQALTYLLIKSLMSHFMNVSYGSVFDTITTSTFQNINVLVPPQEIFVEIKKQVDVNFEQIKENIKENQTLTQLRNTLLPQLISGEVRLKEFREIVEEVVQY